MRRHFRSMALGAALGGLLGVVYPVLAMGEGPNAFPILTAEYALFGATLGFTLSNYLAFRQRLLQRILEESSGPR